ncbi:MAG: UDP-N-acetylmuramoyl-tripeptide--D-alanyl-D-alanine ligase [Opitutaceae bacterium]|nr:UDP-N-acetylmuramoyl-tripeptide--D-alanyl-D-alanine ligase [Opitutaceae bacterium]
MSEFDAEFLAEASGGEWLKRLPASPVTGFCFDTRKLKPGDLFIAIKTETRDGHDFLENAREKGATGALVQEERPSSSLPQLLVDDSVVGFRTIAARFRNRWSFPVIAVTGSCGKTTVKDLLSLLLGGEPIVQATSGNLNNLIGVPATMLSIEDTSCRFAVVEAGISERGEMAKLAETIQADTVVFTAIGPAHLEYLENVDTIASEKAKLSETSSTKRVYLGPTWKPYRSRVFGGEGLLLEEDDSLGSLRSYRRILENGGTRLEMKGPDGVESYRIESMGKGSASNAALAISVVRDCGVSAEDIALRLKFWKPSELRGEWRTFGNTRAYLDCYNANPLSMSDALDVFQSAYEPGGSRLFVIGSMEELGEQSANWHERLGCEIAVEKEDYVRLLGDGSEYILEGMKNTGKHLENTEIVRNVEALQPLLAAFSGDVFLKGSRRYRLETAIDFLKNEPCSEGVSC